MFHGKKKIAYPCGPRCPVAVDGDLEVEDGAALVALGRQRDGGGRADEGGHLLAEGRLGVAGEAPEHGVDERLGHEGLQLLRVHREVGVGQVVVQDLADRLEGAIQ